MAQYVKKEIMCLVQREAIVIHGRLLSWQSVRLVDTAIQVLICRKLKDTEEEDDVRLCHELCLTAAVDVTLKTQINVFS